MIRLGGSGLLVFLVACGGGGGSSDSGGGGPVGGSVGIPNPIMFVTQVPVKADWSNVTGAASNQRPDGDVAYRGGDLCILYPDGTLRKLTEEAGFGVQGQQTGNNAIAVRGPCVHWSGTKAVFSMVRGAQGLGGGGPYYWQIYEVTGLGKNDTAVITRVTPQSNVYNNVDPIYTSDDRIVYASDRPRNFQAHLYPQLDEYNSLRTVTGLWSSNRATNAVKLLNHAPSGAFHPSVDSFGRIIYSRLDHLTRDKQPNVEITDNEDLGPYNFSSEAMGSVPTGSMAEVFPEPNRQWIDYVRNNPGYSGPLMGYGPNLVGHFMNRFMPWTMNQDGTVESTVDGIGEHELGDLGNAGALSTYTLSYTFRDDPNLRFVDVPFANPIQNAQIVRNVLQIREDPATPGMYYAIDARFHDTHASGKLLRFFAPAGMKADQVVFEDRTHPTTANPYASKPAGHTGFYRNPLPMSDGTLVAVHTDDYHKEEDLPGSTVFGAYEFRLVKMVPDGTYVKAGKKLTKGVSKSLQILYRGSLKSFSGRLWELDPVEVVARTPPAASTWSLPAPEASVLSDEGVLLSDLEAYLTSHNAALIVSRDVTTRDGADRQQPYNLRVTGTGKQTIGTSGKIYDVSYLQLFQANLLRGYNGINMQAESIGGRRVLAQPQTDAYALNPASAGPQGSVAVAVDGSIAAIVPARRAMTWQLIDPADKPVVWERYWLTFQPGEVRVCTSCHEVNAFDQAGNLPPVNPPEALRSLLQHLKGNGSL